MVVVVRKKPQRGIDLPVDEVAVSVAEEPANRCLLMERIRHVCIGVLGPGNKYR